jgi:hypothetical protein
VAAIQISVDRHLWPRLQQFVLNMISIPILQLLATTLAFAPVQAGHAAQAWKEGKFKTLVTFGDSYTDENRLGYFIQNNGTAPPVGWEQPVVCNSSVKVMIPNSH